jgi:hypothetical protein
MKKISWALSILIFASLACSLSSQVTPQPTLQPSAEATVMPTASVTSNSAGNSIQLSPPCEDDKWEVVPVSVMSLPGHNQPGWVGTVTPPNGWNTVFVSYAILNGSDLWGRVNIDNTSPTITTEGGFNYSTVGMQGIWMPSDQKISVPITEIQNNPNLGGGNQVYQPMAYITDYIPPNFGVVGSVEGYTTQLGGEPQYWIYYPYYSIFKVAATQKHLTLTLPDIEIDCIQDGVKQQGTISSRIFDLGSYKSDWQKYPTSAYVPDLGSSIDFTNIGTVTIKSVQSDSDSGNVTIKFQFTNSNQGAETSGTLNAYIVDDYGYIHEFQGGQFDAGPAATVDGQDLETFGGVPDDRNMKIVFWIETMQGSTSDSYEAFNFNQ